MLICWLEVDPTHPKLIHHELLLIQQQRMREHNQNNTVNEHSIHWKEDAMNDSKLPQQQQQHQDETKVVKYISSHYDMFGKERFVKLQIVSLSSLLQQQ